MINHNQTRRNPSKTRPNLSQPVQQQRTVLRLGNFCRQMKNIGQTIFGAGPLFLRMVPAVNLAVTVYSKQG